MLFDLIKQILPFYMNNVYKLQYNWSDAFYVASLRQLPAAVNYQASGPNGK